MGSFIQLSVPVLASHPLLDTTRGTPGSGHALTPTPLSLKYVTREADSERPAGLGGLRTPPRVSKRGNRFSARHERGHSGLLGKRHERAYPDEDAVEVTRAKRAPPLFLLSQGQGGQEASSDPINTPLRKPTPGDGDNWPR